MTQQYQYGRDLERSISTGMFFALALSKIKELQYPIDQSLMMHNLYESLSTEEDRVAANLNSLSKKLSPLIKEINEIIVLINEEIKGLDFNYEVETINEKELLKLIKQRLQNIYKLDDAQKLGNENFRLKLGRLFQVPTDSIMNFRDKIKSEQLEETLKGIKKEYTLGLKQALHICSIGYYSTSAFIAGRTLEGAVNDYLERLFLNGNLEKFRVESTSFDDKISLLHKSKLVESDIFHDLQSMRITRNNFAHPSRKILTKEEAHLRIKLCANVISKIQKRG